MPNFIKISMFSCESRIVLSLPEFYKYRGCWRLYRWAGSSCWMNFSWEKRVSLVQPGTWCSLILTIAEEERKKEILDWRKISLPEYLPSFIIYRVFHLEVYHLEHLRCLWRYERILSTKVIQYKWRDDYFYFLIVYFNRIYFFHPLINAKKFESFKFEFFS